MRNWSVDVLSLKLRAGIAVSKTRGQSTKESAFQSEYATFVKLVGRSKWHVTQGNIKEALELAEQAISREPGACKFLRKQKSHRVDKVPFSGTALICEYAPAVLAHSALDRAEEFVKGNKSTYRHSTLNLADEFRRSRHRLSIAYRMWRDLQQMTSREAVVSSFAERDRAHALGFWETWTALGYIRSRGSDRGECCLWAAKLNDLGRILCRYCGVIVKWQLSDYLADSNCPQCQRANWPVWLGVV